nr:ATP-binding protein [Palleronia pontilimi]
MADPSVPARPAARMRHLPRWRSPVVLRSLRGRIICLTVALSYLAAALMGGLAYLRSTEIALETSIASIGGESRVLAARLDGQISAVGDDVLVLSRAPAIAGTLRARQNGGIDPRDQSSLEALERRLLKLFGSVMLSRGDYRSIALDGIWTGGPGLVGMVRGPNGLVSMANDREGPRVPVTQLRRWAAGLQSGDVLMVREGGDGATGLRFVTPITHAGPTIALLSIVVAPDALFAPLLKDAPADTSILMRSAESQPIALAGRTWRDDLRLSGEDRDILRDWMRDGGFTSVTPGKTGGIVFLSSVDAPQWLRGDGLGVALPVDRPTLLAPARPAQRTTLIMAITLFILALTVSLISARIMTRPLGELTKILSSTRTLDDLMDLPTRRRDEIGELSRAFAGLAARLATAEARAGEILDAVHEGVLTFDGQGVVRSANPAAREMLDDSALGRPIADLIPVAPPDLREDQSEGPQGWTQTYSDGRKAYLEVVYGDRTPGPNGFTIAVLRDVTQARELAQMKEEFLATASHELRTPLTAVKSGLVLLRHAISGKIDESDTQLLTLALSNAQRLSRLVDDILSIEKAAAGKLDFHFRALALNGFLGDLARDQQALAQAHRVSFIYDDCDEILTVDVDPDRLEQVIINLLSNAAKFSPAGAEVIIGLQRRGEAVARISVTDHGPGIAEGFRARIFQRFASKDSQASSVQAGTGLGLNIARTLTQSMNGAIGFDTREGHGTTFWVDIPLRR